MGKAKPSSLGHLFQDRFTDIWRLLSETSAFLSRTKEFHQYESQLRDWRAQLQRTPKNSPEIVRIREEITELRKYLRLEGYDLSLGKQNLVFEGFRNDACIAEGFTRVVLFITNENIYWLAGADNHVTLAHFLEQQMEAANRFRQQIRSKHYLWYRRRGNDLVLSGSDTETKEDFERLRAIGNANSLLFLSKLKKLK
ncbi:MAG: hypothetical protein LBU28_11265 [Spirochaetaceae bacterium]|jgi:hypothetical protein|nr:hypothetical protein [Spirochaetaceae bacterium]